jgi:hypothetical protein
VLLCYNETPVLPTIHHVRPTTPSTFNSKPRTATRFQILRVNSDDSDPVTQRLAQITMSYARTRDAREGRDGSLPASSFIADLRSTGYCRLLTLLCERSAWVEEQCKEHKVGKECAWVEKIA